MKRVSVLLVLLAVALFSVGCGVRIFISDNRLRGPAPTDEERAAARATQTVVAANATATPSSAEAENIRAIIADLEAQVGEDLVAEFSFTGRETPRAPRPMREMRIEPGDSIRISAGRSQEVADEADEFCVGSDQERCSRVWVHGRPGRGSSGAWYPIVIFDYDLDQ